MDDEVIKALMDLVSINTYRKNEEGYKKAVEYITSLIEREIPDASVEIVEGISHYGGIKRRVPNIIAHIKGSGEKTVAIVSHYDVVYAEGPRKVKTDEGYKEIDPFEPQLIGNRLYGRGAADDKSAIVASIFAVKKALKELKKNVLLVIVGDEEIGGEGGIMAVKDRVKGLVDEVIVLDGRYKRIANGASGVVHARLTIRGQQGHAGAPFLVRNPVHSLINVLHDLIHELNVFGSYSELEAPEVFEYISDRLSVTILEAGKASANIIPPEASATIDYRYVHSNPKAAEDRLKRLIISSAIANGLSINDVSVEILANHPSRHTPAEHPFVTTFKEIAEEVTGEKHAIGVERGGNDGFVFANEGIPTITYGTMTEDSNIHAPNENLRIDVLQKVIEVLAEYLKR